MVFVPGHIQMSGIFYLERLVEMDKKTDKSMELKRTAGVAEGIPDNTAQAVARTGRPELPGISATRKLAVSSLMVALATVLHLFAVFHLPNGGAITIGSMIPIMLVSVMLPFSWSLAVALAFSLIQIITGFYTPPVTTLGYYILVILLDYIVAFGVLCLAGPIYRAMGKSLPARVLLMASALICIGLRFVCHFFAGILIWSSYAPPDQPVWLYSLLYNGSYMLFEGLISGFILFLAGHRLIDLFVKKSPMNLA